MWMDGGSGAPQGAAGFTLHGREQAAGVQATVTGPFTNISFIQVQSLFNCVCVSVRVLLHDLIKLPAFD